MKWIYIPVMFALAFIYTKKTLNLPIPQNLSSRAMIRRPASASAEVEKIMLKKSPAMVLYKNINSDMLTPFALVTSYKGVIVGNVHVDSFGFIMDDRKKPSYGLMEFDEVTNGALFHDVLAHIASMKNVDKKISWMDYFDYYRSGLMGQPHSNSYYVEKGIQDTDIESEKLIRENVTSDLPVEFIKRTKKNSHHLDIIKKNLIQSRLKKIYPQIQFFDFLQSSMDGEVYQILARINPLGKVQWLVIKENSNTQYDEYFNKDQFTKFQTRQRFVKSVIFLDKMDLSLQNFKIANKNYIVIFKDNFVSKIKWDQVPADDYHDCLMDQAYLLGKIHRSSLDSKVDKYIKAWAKIPAAMVDEKAVELKFKLKDQDQ